MAIDQCTCLQGGPARLGFGAPGDVEAVALDGVEHESVTGGPVVLRVLRRHTSHGRHPLEKGGFPPKPDLEQG